ncbi:hypothetical protein MKW98_023118 [Papaver atlanticum]|uniref:Uncharacterized protein n=1 Tax=Papaver atlanticum TaxID=357466 RepID=A0AAD4TAF6_9MAGN|nr:hypothetical protein MKW98_023118 [Papaver atlanticum]
MEKEIVAEEIEEKINEDDEVEETQPLLNPNPKTVKTKVPEVEINVYRKGRGPIDKFKTNLGGWDQDRLEVVDILDKYGFKTIFAFNTDKGRGVPIRFNARNGRSLLPYRDGSVVFIDGEPKDSLVKPISKILFGLAMSVLLISFVLKERPAWFEKLNAYGGNFPPWAIACAVIVFTRMRKRTRDFLAKFGF